MLLYAVVCWGSGTNKRNIHLLCGGAEATVSEQRTLSRLTLNMDTNHQKRSTLSNGGLTRGTELTARALHVLDFRMVFLMKVFFIHILSYLFIDLCFYCMNVFIVCGRKVDTI